MSTKLAANISLTTPNNPDPIAVLAAIKAQTGDPTAVLFDNRDGTWRGKKAATWSVTHRNEAQTIIDTTPAATPQKVAQDVIDRYPIEVRALVLALIDSLNALRTHPAINLPAVTPAQAIKAIRDKAATL